MAQFEFDRDEVEGVLSGRFYSAREERAAEPRDEVPAMHDVVASRHR